jgi:hypothetical protein
VKINKTFEAISTFSQMTCMMRSLHTSKCWLKRFVICVSLLSHLVNTHAQNLRLRGQSAAGAGDDTEDDEDDVDDDSDIEEELGYFSPLDAVNPYSSFKQALTGTPPPRTRCRFVELIFCVAFQLKNGAGYQAGTTSLNMEQQTFLMEVMNMSENEEAKA